MKKIIILFAALGLLLQGCQKPDQEFIHDDPTVTAFYVTPAKSIIATTIQAVIDQETGEVNIPIPKKLAEYYDPTQLKVRASVGYDVKITPSLMGIHDLSEPVEFTATCTQTGRTKVYTLNAYYSRDIK